MVTEAGILGKIGFNSYGVGVCLNAIRTHGMDPSHIPVHLGLRMVLESVSASEAIDKLESVGMASSAHMLIADTTTATGLEFTSATFGKLTIDTKGRVIHANHLLLPHPNVQDTLWLKDSSARVATMERNTSAIREPLSWSFFSQLFEDETGYPGSICRAQVGPSHSATLFNIVMELKEKKAVVRMGRPTQVEETFELSF